MYLFSFPISIDVMFHCIMYSQLVSCCLVPCLSVLLIRSACIFSLLFIDLMFHLSYYIQVVSCCLVPLFEHACVCVEKFMHVFFSFPIH